MSRSGSALAIGMTVALCAGSQAFAATDGAVTIYHSPPLDHAVPRNIDGTTLNLVTGVFDDAGPLSGDWDINFWSDYKAGANSLAFFTLDEYQDQLVVDAGGQIAVLQPGDRIGPDSTFAASADPSPDWRAGIEGYLGIKFVCAGRGFFPSGDFCYGYIHVVSGTDRGFPATIVDYAFDTAGFDIGIVSPATGCTTKDTIFCNGLDDE